MDMPRPTDAHRKLEKFAGHWSGEETMHPSPWDPKGGVAQARIRTRRALDGFAAIGDYEQLRDGAVTFTGHSVYTWDAQRKDYALYWFDSMGTEPNVFRGTFDGDVLVITSVAASGHTRMTYDLSKPGVLRSKLEMSQDGKSWKVFMEGRYRRTE